MRAVDKNNPSPEWIEDLRRRFPCEKEIDRVLTRKMRRRGGPGYSSVSLETLVKGTESLIRSELGEPFEIANARWLSGGASKLQMAFSLTWNRPGAGRETTPMVLRMEPAESIVETSRLREYQLIRAFEGIVPVPQAFWVDMEGTHLPYPAMIYGFATGVTKPSNATSQAAGYGTYIAPEWRGKLGPQFVECLARIHTRDIASAGLTAFDVPRPGKHSIELMLNWWDRVWEEDSDQDMPLMRLASGWLRENAPVCDRHSIIHCDYRVGNFLFTEHDARITAILDWELGCIGDRHHDIAWTVAHAWGHYHEDGRTFLVGGFMPEEAFFEAYEKASGLTVDPRTLYYYKVFTAYMQGVIALATTYRIARNGKTHQDVLVAWIQGIAPKMLDVLRLLLEEGA